MKRSHLRAWLRGARRYSPAELVLGPRSTHLDYLKFDVQATISRIANGIVEKPHRLVKVFGAASRCSSVIVV
jgi:hypothetical protein